MLRKITTLGIGLLLFTSPLLVSAQSDNTSESALIAVLTQLVHTLEQELQALIAAKGGSSTTIAPTCTIIASPSSVHDKSTTTLTWMSTNTTQAQWLTFTSEGVTLSAPSGTPGTSGSVSYTPSTNANLQLPATVVVQMEVFGAGGTNAYCSTTFTITGANTAPTTPVASSTTMSSVYRFYNPNSGEHFYTTNQNEVTTGQGWRNEGTGFLMLKDYIASSTPIYRCYIPSNNLHFISNDFNCEATGITNEGTYGYLYSSQLPGTLPVYRCYNTTSGDHLITANSSECSDNNYVTEGIMGYTPSGTDTSAPPSCSLSVSSSSVMVGSSTTLTWTSSGATSAEWLSFRYKDTVFNVPSGTPAASGTIQYTPSSSIQIPLPGTIYAQLKVYGSNGTNAYCTTPFTLTGANTYTPPAVVVATTTTNVYRFYNPNSGEHFFSLNQSEVNTGQGWQKEGIGFLVLKNNVSGANPIYRCFSPSISLHFVSGDVNCEATAITNEGMYGYVYSSQYPNTVPLYRCYNASNRDHMETTASSECTNNYALEGVTGYVPLSANNN